MEQNWLFIGIPLILFVILDFISGEKAALIGAILGALFEFTLSYYYVGGIDWTSIVSVLLVVLLAGFSLWKKNSFHFKLQPAILSFLIALLFGGSYLFDHPFLYEMLIKYKEMLPLEMRGQLELIEVKNFFSRVSLFGGIFFFIHGFFMVWVAKNKGNLFWIFSRVLGTILACFLSVVFAKIF